MNDKTVVTCKCGMIKLEMTGRPIVVAECLCNSCRAAADRLHKLQGAPKLLTSYGATPYAEYRKDRVRIVSGAEQLREFRLNPQSGSRRVIACCCNTPVFLELKGAHWLSVYLNLWPESVRLCPELRTMTGDLADQSRLPTDIPNLKTHSLAFYAKLFVSWACMGFSNPKINVEGKVDV